MTENYKGEEIEFACNPDGTVHILPATAGPKRYSVHDAINPIPGNCAFRLSTSGMGGCFLTTEIDGDKLIMKSYLVDDETNAVTLIDRYAIKKDVGQNQAEKSELPTDTASNVLAFMNNFVSAIGDAAVKYTFVLLPQAIMNAIRK